MKLSLLFSFFCLFSFFSAFSVQDFQIGQKKEVVAKRGMAIDAETPVADLLEYLGERKAEHKSRFTDRQVKQGEEIVKYGRTQRNGRKSKRVSKHYVCTTCHNIEQEDPILTESNPETRLAFAKENGLPFLQGSTFKGIVNRESWYNDDYVKKYGDEKIEKAHKDLREASQLCAIECAQGRPMKAWELEAVIAYYWSLQFHMGDLDLSSDEWSELLEMAKDDKQHEKAISFIKSKYLQASPATFFDAPPSKEEGYKELVGDPKVGEDLYNLSCLHCHKPDGVSHYLMDHSKMTFRHLERNITKNSHFSLYQIIAYGTYALPGHRPYMPHYPLERMSLQQVEDLRAYIEQEAQ